MSIYTHIYIYVYIYIYIYVPALAYDTYVHTYTNAIIKITPKSHRSLEAVNPEENPIDV